MKHAKDILATLDARRRQLKMSCRAVAERSGLSTRTVQGVLQARKSPSLSTVAAIAEAVGTKIELARTSSSSAIRRRQARDKAHRLAMLAQGSAALEVQAVDPETIKRAERRIAAKLLSGVPLRLWS